MICITYINLTQQENAYNLKKEKKKESWGGGAGTRVNAVLSQVLNN